MDNAINTQKLFEEFPPVTREEWMAQVSKDLKGADFAKKLVWKSPAGFDLMPFYREDDLENNTLSRSLPGKFPFHRGYNTNSNSWYIRQDIPITSPAETNRKAHDILCRGANAIGFICNAANGITFSGFNDLLNGIKADAIELNFASGNSSPALISMLSEWLKQEKLNPETISGSFDFDPLGELVTTGNYCCKSGDIVFSNLHGLIAGAKEALPKFRILAVHGIHFHSAGASLVQELAYSLSQAVEYFQQIEQRGLKVCDIAPRMSLVLGVGSNYFMEIARLRAARLLWSKILESWGIAPDEIPALHIHCETSAWNISVYDPHVNTLRATTSAMSAILGGCSSLTVHPFDAAFAKAGEFSERIARNIQLILKEESKLDKVVDPAGGSYYIETLTESISEEAWKLFLAIEDEGGFLAALKAGIIQKALAETAARRQTDIAQRREILLGTNQYPNQNESISSEVDLMKMFQTSKINEETLVEPLYRFRGAEAFEKLRLATERHPDGAPSVFLFTYGNLNMRKARAGFATNFFACAGMKVIDNPGFETIDEGIKAALESKARFVVICSGDDEYASIVPEIIPAIKDYCIPVLAGYPADLIESFKTIGLTHFIHMRSNVLETLRAFLQLAGVSQF